MNNLGKMLLASAATIVLCGTAHAADLPTYQPPLVPSAAPTYCTDPIKFIVTDCPLSAYGITFYGTIDMGVGYESHGAPFNPDIITGVQELIRKNSTGSRWLATPGGLSQSNIGLKGVETITPGFDFVFDLNFGFNPYGLTAANGPKSLVDNNGVAQANQSSNADSSRGGQFYNSTGYAGISSKTFGTLTFGHQNSLELDGVIAYDPMSASYAFSVIGWQGTAVGGGDTEDARVTSVKYRVNVGDNLFRLGALVEVGGYDTNNGAQNSYGVQIGKDFDLGRYGKFSGDAIYTNDKNAVSASSLSAVQAAAFPNTLAATVSDNQSFMLLGKYTYDKVRLFGGYEYIDFRNPSSPLGSGFTNLSGYGVAFPNINQTAFSFHDEHLQIMWAGARYAFTSTVDAGVAYYHYDQNSFGKTFCNNTSASTCAGTLNAASFNVDWKFAAKFDVYAGMMYSSVQNGLANGYLHTNNFAPTAGLRFRF
ncbi:porin [Beijerinckia sp. L45]|uniref:porin n=1 Tax=Beijerinckia sp. L45 TaxID=1641855 RepID=UPI00131AF545|nr:porin [Beijerinckia sp. L45]